MLCSWPILPLAATTVEERVQCHHQQFAVRRSHQLLSLHELPGLQCVALLRAHRAVHVASACMCAAATFLFVSRVQSVEITLRPILPMTCDVTGCCTVHRQTMGLQMLAGDCWLLHTQGNLCILQSTHKLHIVAFECLCSC